jgi:hypothetical protein
MGDAAELPSDVAIRVRKYLDLPEAENADFVRHVYLVGSIALGDYRKGMSDIDFVALVACPLSELQSAALARAQAAMTGDRPHFDGFNIEQAELRQYRNRNPLRVSSTVRFSLMRSASRPVRRLGCAWPRKVSRSKATRHGILPSRLTRQRF